MSDEVIIIGAGGHAKVIADIISSAGGQVLGFLDDDPGKTEVLGLPVLGTVSNWSRLAKDVRFVLGIGSNAVRKQLAGRISGPWYIAVHPSAQIGQDTVIGRGTVVMANAVINPGSRIGQHCIINTGAVVEHDNIIGDYVHLSPHATLCGTVTVGEGSHIGAGAVIKNNLSICGGVTLGAGAVVVRDILEPGTYVGVPARRIS